MAEKIAEIADSIPLADYFRLRVRILKLGALNTLMLNKLSIEYGVKAPLDKLALLILFIISSYIPPLLASLIYTCFIKKEAVKRFDASTYTYNKADSIGEISKLLN